MDYLCLGEPLIEFTAMPDHPEGFLRNAGGDTLNTAIYLSRLLGARRVGYLSCLGDDGHSLWLRDRIASEGIDISALSARAGARPGLSFVTIPVTHAGLTLQIVGDQMAACAASDGPVLAYCASGTRCTIVWALGQAGRMDTDTIIRTAADHGYNLHHLRDQLEVLAAQG